MRDVDTDPDEEGQYECFECGNIITAKNRPVSCPACRGPLRNRRTPLE